MATRKPLVIVSGQVQRLQSGDTIDSAVTEVDHVSMSNGNASPIVIGNAVYVSDASEVDLAKADAASTMEVLGLVKDASIAAAASGTIQTDGIMSATTGQWDAVTGETGGLTAGAIYYLDETIAGNITETAPTAVGKYVVRIGQAISTTELEITVTKPIKL